MRDNEFKDLLDANGTYYYNDKPLALTQQPFADTRLYGGNRLDGYFAEAIDENENPYLLFWPMTNPGVEDESEACNWAEYTVLKI